MTQRHCVLTLGPSPDLILELSCLRTEESGYPARMIILGLLLLLLGMVLATPILWTIGIAVLIVGAILMLLGRAGRGIGGRSHYW